MTRRHGRNEEPDPDVPQDVTCNLSVLDQAEQVLDNAAQHARLVPTVEYIQRVERKSDRNRNIVIAVVLLIAVIGLVIGTVAYTEGIKNAAQISVNRSALDTYNEAIAELRAKGVPEDQLPPPPLTPADSPTINVDGLVDAASAKVLAEVRNNPAYIGPEGDQGPEGPGGPGGPPGEPCDPASNPACVGPEGDRGQPGTPGTNGDDGAPGTPGDDGVDGTDGVDGAPGGEGPKGDVGPKPVAADFSRDGAGTCQYVTNYDDGSVTRAPAPDNLCNPAPVVEPE